MRWKGVEWRRMEILGSGGWAKRVEDGRWREAVEDGRWREERSVEGGELRME